MPLGATRPDRRGKTVANRFAYANAFRGPFEGPSEAVRPAHPAQGHVLAGGVSDATARLLEEALRLDVRERAELAAELIASVDGEPGADADGAWAAEIERDPIRRSAALGRLLDFWRDYRLAWLRFAAGDRAAVFPSGTYALRVRFGVHCADTA